MALRKPKRIAENVYKSKIGDQIEKENKLVNKDIPLLTVLCDQFEIVEQCQKELACENGIQLTYQTEYGDHRALPQIQIMDKASSQIRAICKQMGINNMDAEPKQQPEKKAVTLKAIRGENNVRRSAKPKTDVRAKAAD